MAKRIIVIILIILVPIILLVYYLWSNEPQSPNSNSSENQRTLVDRLKGADATPTPFPFDDMTIPYLQTRTYESKLGELERVSENDAYISYKTSYLSDGLKVYGLLTVPKNAQIKHPAIVFIHGYIVPTVYRTNSNYASYVDYLARRGFVVFKIDLRGHDRSEGDASGAYYSGDYIVDTLNAYSALQNTDFVDPGKVGLWGHSMAGNVVFRSMIAKKDVPAAVVWAGAGYTYTDLQDYGIDDNSYRPPAEDSERARKRQELADRYGQFDPNHWFWKQVPGSNYLKGVSGALQLNHAVDDNVVSVEYSRNLKKVLEGSGITVDLQEFSSGGHNITGANFGKAMQNTVNFFNEHFN